MKPTPVNTRYCQIFWVVIHAFKNITEKMYLLKNVWPENSALFIYISTHCVETVKKPDYTWYSRWLGGAVVWFRCVCEKSRVQFPAPARFFMIDFVCFVVAFFLFVQKYIICNKTLQLLFAMLIYIVNMLQDLWPIIRV